MLRGVGLLQLQARDDGSSAEFAVTQTLDDGDACRVPQALKEVGFEFSNSVVHIYIRKFEYKYYIQDTEVASRSRGVPHTSKTVGVAVLRMDFGVTSSYGPGDALVASEAFKICGGQIHAVEAFLRVMKAGTPSGWNYEMKKAQ